MRSFASTPKDHTPLHATQKDILKKKHGQYNKLDLKYDNKDQSHPSLNILT